MSSVRSIDLNCDLGEGTTAEQLEAESRIMRFVTSVNVACGVHAGSPATMRRTIRLARGLGLAIGAHPGLSDRDGRGRRAQDIAPEEAARLVSSQTTAIRALCEEENTTLSHVKAHGALYNMAARDRALADAIARAIHDVDGRLILVGLAGSQLIAAGRSAGLPTAAEAFIDRAYRPDGTLVPRTEAGAVLEQEEEIVHRALALARDGTISATDGSRLVLHPVTLCLHGDTPGADRLAERVRRALLDAGIRLVRLDRLHG